MEKSNQFVECPIYGTRQISILPSVIPGTLGKPPTPGPTHIILGFRKRRIRREMKKKTWFAECP